MLFLPEFYFSSLVNRLFNAVVRIFNFINLEIVENKICYCTTNNKRTADLNYRKVPPLVLKRETF